MLFKSEQIRTSIFDQTDLITNEIKDIFCFFSFQQYTYNNNCIHIQNVQHPEILYNYGLFLCVVKLYKNINVQMSFVLVQVTLQSFISYARYLTAR